MACVGPQRHRGKKKKDFRYQTDGERSSNHRPDPVSDIIPPHFLLELLWLHTAFVKYFNLSTTAKDLLGALHCKFFFVFL